MNSKNLIAVLAVLANLGLAVGKITVGLMANSTSILADGINSGTDVIASTISFIGIKTAEKPPDKEHPYGHEKAEVISGFIITLIILVTGLWIIYDAIRNFFTGTEPTLTPLAFIVMGISALTNLIMSQLKIHYGKKFNSVSLVSDGIHSRIDLLVSLGIFISLFFIPYLPFIDSIIALLVGAYILKEALTLGKETTDSLLGRSSPETENKIKNIIENETPELVNLKTQKLGKKVFAEISLKFPPELNIHDADSLIKKIEHNLISHIDELSYTAIKIESYDMERRYFRSGYGKGLGWQKTHPNKNEKVYCVCPQGDYRVEHQRGTPCASLKCPNHHISLVREDLIEKNKKKLFCFYFF